MSIFLLKLKIKIDFVKESAKKPLATNKFEKKVAQDSSSVSEMLPNVKIFHLGFKTN